MLRVFEVQPGKRIIVETDETLVPSKDESTTDLPPGTQLVSAGKIANLSDQLEGLSALASEALNSNKPSEVSVEAHLKFSGTTQIIPFITSGSGEGGIKITLTWKQNR